MGTRGIPHLLSHTSPFLASASSAARQFRCGAVRGQGHHAHDGCLPGERWWACKSGQLVAVGRGKADLYWQAVQ